MEKLTFKTIENREETNLFLEKFENYTNIRLPYSYARRGKVVGVFSHDKLVAGYMLITKPNFRSLLFIPDQVKNQEEFFGFDRYEMMEVNGLWISPAVKTPKAQFKIWITLLKDIFFARKKYLLLMSDSRNRTIQYIHSLTNPVTLYEGSPNLDFGEQTHTGVRIGYTTRWKAILNIPKYFIELKNREHRVDQAYKRRLNLQTQV